MRITGWHFKFYLTSKNNPLSQNLTYIRVLTDYGYSWEFPVIQNANKNHLKPTIITLYLSLSYFYAQVKYLVLFFCCMQKFIYLKLISGYLKDSLTLNLFFMSSWSLEGGAY